MKPSEKCLALVKRFEAFRAYPYQDLGGLWTIGYGHRMAAQENIQDHELSEKEAEHLLEGDLASASAYVLRFVTSPLNQDQFDAVTSFVLNVGGHAFAKSLVCDFLNKEKFDEASIELLRWCHVKGQFAAGLWNRRTVERQLFIGALK